MNRLPHPDLVHQRLANQRLSGNPFESAADIVGWLGAVQSQDYAGAKWAIAQRSQALTDTDLNAAFNRGDILRTHVLRPTWHFVLPTDIRWLLDLTSPFVRNQLNTALRKADVTPATIDRWNQIIGRELEGGRALTREELFAAFAAHDQPLSGQPGGFVLMLAEVDQLVCSGPLSGKQHTYMLLDERVPKVPVLSREEALANLAIRYFQSHGPGHERDLAWWSSLSLSDCRQAIALAGKALEHTTLDGTAWYGGPALAPPAAETPHVRLLPNYDEYFSRDGLRTRYPGPSTPRLDAMLADRFDGHHLLIDGLLRGSWKRTLTRRLTRVRVEPFAPLTLSEREAVTLQAERLALFHGLPLELVWSDGYAPPA